MIFDKTMSLIRHDCGCTCSHDRCVHNQYVSGSTACPATLNVASYETPEEPHRRPEPKYDARGKEKRRPWRGR